MLNSCFMFLTVLVGLLFLWADRRKSETLKVTLIITTFCISRMFFRFAWQSVTGGAIAVSPTADFYLLLVLNFITLSIIFLPVVNLFTPQRFGTLGWTKDKIGRNLLFGFVLGGLSFFILTFHKNLKPENLPIAIFFSFFIASWQEETIFRGHLLTYFTRRFDTEEAIIYQALAFALAHIGFYPFHPLVNLVVSLVFAFVIGLILGYVRLKTKSQIPGFILHGMIDVAFLISS